MSKKIFAAIASGIAGALLMPGMAFAHVIVTPNQAGIGAELTFTVSVPNERQVPVVKLALDIPAGVTDVTPTAQSGWTIHTASDDSAADPQVTAVTWTDGSIPVGEREDFSFSAQVPGRATQLDWKAYQTYADGTVVHWDQKPGGSDDATGNAGPYSITKVVDDLTASTPAQRNTSSQWPLALSIAAVAFSIGGMLIRAKR